MTEPLEGLPFSPPKMIVCVGACVLHEQRILFIRQAKGASLEGQWSIPWGFVDEGETPDHAALREIYEEARVDAKVDGLLGIQNLRSPGWIGIIYACHSVSGEPTPDGNETDRAAFFTRDEISSSSEPIEEWCKWLALRILDGQTRIIIEEPGTPFHPNKAFL